MSNPQRASKAVRLQVAGFAVLAGVGILAMKYYASVVSGSASLRADAIESVVNVVAAIFTFGAVVFAEKPADKDHPYGHGKIEYFSAAFEGGLISLAAALIAWEALSTLHEQFVFGVFKLKDLGRGIIWNTAAGSLNGCLGLFLIFMGRRHRSKSIEADGQHVLSDFWTTLGILAGLLLVKVTGIQTLDPLMALLVSALLARTGFMLVRSSSQALLDMEDPELLQKIIEVINQIRPNDVIALHELRTMRSGRFIHVDIHIVVPRHYTVDKGHDLAESFGEDAIQRLGVEGEMHTHVDPCKATMCGFCAVDDCPARTAPKSPPPPLTVENSTAPGD